MLATDVLDMVLVRSNGERHTGEPDEPARVDLRLAATSDHNGSPEVTVDAEVTVARISDSDLQYSGTSTFLVKLRGPVAESELPQVAALVWPHLRADLLAQCARIARQNLSLPIAIDPAVLGKTTS